MQKKFNIGYLYIILCTLIFSIMEVMLKLPSVAGSFNPMQITVERFIIGGIFLIPFSFLSLKKSGLKIQNDDIGRFILTGFLCVPVSMVLYQLAISSGAASKVAIVFSGNPIFVTIFAFLFLGESIHKGNIIALFLEIIGIIVILNPFSDTTKDEHLCIALSVLSALTFALYGVSGRKLTKRYSGIVVTCMSFLFGGFELLILLLIGHINFAKHFFNVMNLNALVNVPFFSGINKSTLPFFLFICIVNSALGFAFHMLATEKTNAITAGFVFFFKPIIAPLFAFFILGEHISIQMVIGICLLLVGSFFGLYPEIKSR